MYRNILLWALVLPLTYTTFSSTNALARSGTLKPLSVEASIEMRRLENAADESPISFSPDHSRYVIRIAQDDLKAGGTWVEFLTGRTDSLEGAKPVQLARVFTTGAIDRKIGATPPTQTTSIKWLDNDRFLFLWHERNGSIQIMLGDTKSGEVKQLTSHNTSVTSFTIWRTTGNRRGEILYSLFPNREVPARKLDKGVAVSDLSFIISQNEGFDVNESWMSTEVYLFNPEVMSTKKIGCPLAFCKHYGFSSLVNYSTSGRYLSYIDEYSLYIIALDVQTSKMVEVWKQGFGAFSFKPLWSPVDDRVIVGPIAMTPGEAANSYAELDPVTGRMWKLPVEDDLAGRISSIRAVRWRPDGIVELRKKSELLAFRREGEKWVSLTEVPPLEDLETPSPAVRVEIRQDRNTSPRVVAIDTKSGREQLLVDVEPRMKEYTLGRVERVEFADRNGVTWEGRLTYPVGYRLDTRYPMVIVLQSEVEADTFSLTAIRPKTGPLYAAQALANRGIAVLTISGGITGGKARGVSEFLGTSREGEAITVAFESAVDHFVTKGIARPDKIGLAGHSRTGSYVQQAITRSSYPFAAAISSDNVNFGYFQYLMTPFVRDGFTRVNGAPPHGEGLKKWLENAPPFNAHKVRTPLRIEAMGDISALMYASEMFAQLKILNKPVELVRPPYPDRALHWVEMPAQKQFSQGGTVDWFDFWLNGREDPAPEKAEQYERWRKLRQQQEASIAKTVAARTE